MEDFKRFKGKRHKFEGVQVECPKCGEMGVIKVFKYVSGRTSTQCQHFYTNDKPRKLMDGLVASRQVHACVIK